MPEDCALASLTIYDISGRRIAMESLESTPGRHSLVLDVEDYPQGVYIARIAGEGTGTTRRFVITR
ncbi:MAG: T9SS type A sorting domain-containing protein [Candidatus Coatesbacteria bacterium]|nr:T9SS type A sorting domain-containing protein [Candidatus Coatesbacteria bacterium]